jgi:chondroitin AC lyase
VATTVNQCLLKDDVTVKTGNKQSKLEAGNHEFNNAKWIFHNGVGYLFPEQTQVNCSNQSQRGSWYEISKQYSTPENKISKEVFKLWIDHGKGPEGDKYQYTVVPATTARELEKRMKNRKIEVVVNTSAQQAVKNEALGVYQGVFHQSGEIRFTRDLLVQNHDSGIVMLKTEEGTISEISVADPSQKLNEIHLSVSSHIDNDMDQCRTVWNEDKQMTDITVELPQGVYAGKSVIIELQ